MIGQNLKLMKELNNFEYKKITMIYEIYEILVQNKKHTFKTVFTFFEIFPIIYPESYP